MRLFYLLIAWQVSYASGLNEIFSISDVHGVEQEYDTDIWGVVNFAPVPAFDIDTHDPKTQDQFISASVHSREEPWDRYIWDRIVSLTPPNVRDSNLLFVDVGANIGYFTLTAASMGYNVVAFEPMSRNANKVIKSVLINELSPLVHLYQNAVTDRSGEYVVLKETAETNQGNGQIVADGGETKPPGVYGVDYVGSVTLSDVFWGRDAFIVKIDVEGRENEVLAGARKWICSSTVKHIIIEISDVTKSNARYPLTALLDFMKSAGYEIRDVAVGSDVLKPTSVHQMPPNVLFSLKGPHPTCK